MASISKLLNKGIKPVPLSKVDIPTAVSKTIPLPDNIKKVEASSKVLPLSENTKTTGKSLVNAITEGGDITATLKKLTPSQVGVFDDILKYGSGRGWVTQGAELYKQNLAKLNATKRFLKTFSSLEEYKNNPGAALHTINRVLTSFKHPGVVTGIAAVDNALGLRKNPIPMAKDIGNIETKDMAMITDVITKILGKKGETHTRLFEKIEPNQWLGDSKYQDLELRPKKDSSAYKKSHDPYGEVKNINTPAAIKKYLNELKIGYNNWQGYEVGSDHIWSIKMRPYHGSTDEGEFPYSGNYSAFGPFPKYSIPRYSTSEDKILVADFDFGEFLPCTDYALEFGKQKTLEIPLFNGKFTIPVGFNFDINLTLNIVDDIYHSMKKYLVQCINNIYNVDKNEAVPFYKTAWVIDLTVFRSGFEKNYRVKLIGCPINYSHSYNGEQEAKKTMLNLSIGIIGIIDTVNSQIGENNWEKKTSWTQVSLNPNGKVMTVEQGQEQENQKASAAAPGGNSNRELINMDDLGILT